MKTRKNVFLREFSIYIYPPALCQAPFTLDASILQHAHANYGTHCSKWECPHSSQATSKGLPANLRGANLLARPVWTGPQCVALVFQASGTSRRGCRRTRVWSVSWRCWARAPGTCCGRPAVTSTSPAAPTTAPSSSPGASTRPASRPSNCPNNSVSWTICSPHCGPTQTQQPSQKTRWVYHSCPFGSTQPDNQASVLDCFFSLPLWVHPPHNQAKLLTIWVWPFLSPSVVSNCPNSSVSWTFYCATSHKRVALEWFDTAGNHGFQRVSCSPFFVFFLGGGVGCVFCPRDSTLTDNQASEFKYSSLFSWFQTAQTTRCVGLFLLSPCVSLPNRNNQAK